MVKLAEFSANVQMTSKIQVRFTFQRLYIFWNNDILMVGGGLNSDRQNLDISIKVTSFWFIEFDYIKMYWWSF